MKIKPIKTNIFHENENLLSFICEYLPKRLRDNCVLAVTSKIAALSEGRTDNNASKRNMVRLIKLESSWAVPAKYVWLTKTNGQIMASAGIDKSNGKGKLILLPKDSYETADIIRKALINKFGLKHFGVIITDSRTQPLRSGIVGAALGYAGFSGLKSYHGKKDLFGRKFLYSSVNIADCLATAAVLVMGEGNERQPLALIENPPIKFITKLSKKELQIPFKQDIYKPILKQLKNT